MQEARTRHEKRSTSRLRSKCDTRQTWNIKRCNPISSPTFFIRIFDADKKYTKYTEIYISVGSSEFICEKIILPYNSRIIYYHMANERNTEILVRDHFKLDPLFSIIKWEEQKSMSKRVLDLLT